MYELTVPILPFLGAKRKKSGSSHCASHVHVGGLIIQSGSQNPGDRDEFWIEYTYLKAFEYTLAENACRWFKYVVNNAP